MKPEKFLKNVYNYFFASLIVIYLYALINVVTNIVEYIFICSFLCSSLNFFSRYNFKYHKVLLVDYFSELRKGLNNFELLNVLTTAVITFFDFFSYI